MTATPSSNVFQSGAQSLAGASNRTVPEQIYHEALEELRRQAVDDEDSRLLAQLPLVHDENTFNTFLEQELGQNRRIGPRARKRIDRKAARLSGNSKRALELAKEIASFGPSQTQPILNTN
jgi:hypothetical protein